VTNNTVTQTSFEDAPVTIQAEVSAIGFAGEEIVGSLYPVEAGKESPRDKPIIKYLIIQFFLLHLQRNAVV